MSLFEHGQIFWSWIFGPPLALVAPTPKDLNTVLWNELTAYRNSPFLPTTTGHDVGSHTFCNPLAS